MDNLSSGGNFVAGRRPGGLSRWRPKSHLESQLLLNSNLKTVVGAAKINPSLGRIFVDSETNNAYLLTTDGNPAQCNKMVDKQTNASVGGKIKQVPGLDAGATLLQGNELSRQLGFIDNKVNRCLARYSPRATTTNRPTNRAPKKPAWPGPN